MKKLFTFCSVCILLQSYSQNSIIKVKIADICENLFTHSLTVDLYKINTNDTIYISSSFTNPAVFSNLTEPGMYMVKFSSNDTSKAKINLKDLVHLRNIILGLSQQTNLATPIIGDVDISGELSNLDMDLLSRYIIDLNPVSLNEWQFFSKYVYSENGVNPYPSNINSIVFNTTLLNTTEVLAYAFKKGELASTLPSTCELCSIDSFNVVNIFLPSIELKKDSTYNLDIKVGRLQNDLGGAFSLNYHNIEVLSVNPETSTIFNEKSDDNSINFLQLYSENYQSYNNKIASIIIKAKTDGMLETMLTLNQNFKNEFIFQDSSCIKSYPIIQVDYLSTACHIQWPEDITVQNCNALGNTGSPIIPQDCADNYFSYYVDEIIGNPCEKILRHWQSMNILTIENFFHTQTISINANYETVCNDVEVVLENEKIIYAVDLLNTAIQGHQYSFSPNNIVPSKLFKFTYPYIEFVKIYDLTASEYCISKVTKLRCVNKANVNEMIDVKANGLEFYTVSAEMFNAGTSTECSFNIVNFQISDTSNLNYTSLMYFPVKEFKGQSIYLKLRYMVEGNFVEHGLVQVNFIDQMIPILNFNCYDDLVIKNEPYQIDIFSSNFNNILGVQGGIIVKDAIIKSTKKSKLYDIQFNQKPGSLIFVWLENNLQPLSLLPEDTLFSFIILPTKTSNLSDFISLSDSLVSSEAVLYENLSTKIDLAFTFIKRTASENLLSIPDFSISPNPSTSNIINIHFSNFNEAKLRLIDLNGKVHLSSQLQDSIVQQVQLPSNISNGLYFLEFTSPKGKMVKKLIIAK